MAEEILAIESVWEYQYIANTIPADPSAETVPSADWVSGGVSPFGTIPDVASAILVPYPPNTAWADTSGLWVRRNFTADGVNDVLIKGMCDNVGFFFIDGTYMGVVNQAEEDRVARYALIVPKSVATEGTHEIAVMLFNVENMGSGDSTYFYAEAEPMPAMLPFQPEAPVKETLKWSTDVGISRDGTEDRLKLNTAPIQSFEYTYPLNAVRKLLALNTAWGALPKTWMVPVWSQARYHGAVTAGLTTLTGANTSNGEFRDASYVLLWESDTNWQVIFIDQIDGTTLELVGFTQAFTAAWLMPLREGFIPGGLTRRFNGYEASMEIEFRVRDIQELTVSAPTQYNSQDIYSEPGLLAGDNSSDNIDGGIDIFDPGFGLLDFYQAWNNARTARTHRVVCEDMAEAWALRQFLHRRAGRYRAFYQPTFENDIRLDSTGTLTDTIRVFDDGYLPHSAARTHIAVQTRSGWLFREITLAEDVGSGKTDLTLSSALSVAATSVLRVCWLGLHRLNTDSVEIRYVGNNVALTEFRIMEIAP